MAKLSSVQKSATSTKAKFLVATTGAVSLSLALALVISATTDAAAVQPTVNLGSAETFAVLAGSGITNTGPTTASGTYGADFGSSPIGTFIGSASVTTTGVKFIAADPLTAAAQSDLTLAYIDAAGRIPATTIAGDLGGQTLTQGAYVSATSIGLTGTLTLNGENDPNAVFIFQAGSTLTTASASRVVLTNGAQPCNVFWQVGSSATFGTTTDFTGRVLALTSITANTGATFKGQLLARNGAVTLDTNTILNDRCAAVPIPTVTTTVTAPPPTTATPTPTPDVTPSLIATPSPVASTDTGGQLPDTDAVSWPLPLAFGISLMAFGGAVYFSKRRRH